MEPAKRKPNRLAGHDYNQAGMYFLTLCALNRQCLFGSCAEGGDLEPANIRLSGYGVAVQNWILDCASRYSDLTVESYVIMPNHIHLLVSVQNGPSEAPAPTPEDGEPAREQSVCVGGGPRTPRCQTRANERIPMFVSALKRMTNKICGCPVWQRGYHDHIVRNEDDFRRIRQYIDTNPAKWAEDTYYVR